MKQLFLVGPPGSGKSTLARLVAERLHLTYADSDAAVEERCGCDIPTIFAQRGEEAFREEESAVLRELCEQNAQIIATGGGAVLRLENRETMRRGLVVYVDTSEERLAERVSSEERPVLTKKSLAQLLEERRPLYEACADQVVQNDNLEEGAAALESIWKEQNP